MIYDGTLYGHWEAIVTMQQLIVLATPDGVVEMTPQAIAARTSIPFDIIEKGLKVLAQPDPYSRTPGEDGKRIVLMDESRPWGWKLVNHGKYMRLRNMAQKREADRARIAEKRSINKNVAIESQPVANVAHSDSDSDSDSKNKNKAQAPFVLPDWIPIDHWNAWLEARKKLRKSPTDYAKKHAVEKLAVLRDQGFAPGQILRQSAFNGWAGLFPLKEIK